MTVEQFIENNIDKTTRYEVGDNPILVALPKPYTVPSVSDAFQEMYYWDTYFTNKGLILLGRTEQAISNLENFVWLIDKYGFIPNGSCLPLLNRSQPPVFALAVADVWRFLDVNKKKIFLSALKKEHSFWEQNRKLANLNHYDCTTTAEE